MVRPASSLLAVVVFVVGLAAVVGAACDPPPAQGCGTSCAVSVPACADGCPAIADELCVDDACVARGDDAVDLAINVNLGRDLQGVIALSLAIVDGRGASCDDVGAASSAVNVLAGNRKEVSGGTFHPDLRVGLVPEGPVLVVVDALDAAFADTGVVVATGCVAVDAGGSSDAVTVDVPTL